MALFKRRDKTAEIASAVASELVKAGYGQAVPGFNGASVMSYVPGQPTNIPAGAINNVSGTIEPLARPFEEFGSIMGPAYPLLPMAIDTPLDASGRPLPRKYQYQIADNLDLTFENQPWNVLRALAETCDIIHRAIEIRITDITRMDWSWNLSDQAIDSIMAEEKVSHAKASNLGRQRYGEQLASLERFWTNPYPQIHRGFTEWITEFLWAHLVYDGTPVYPRYNLKGNCIGFEVLDPSTIKVLLDNRGGQPLPPAPAFQQILWGFPRGEFLANPEGEEDPEKPVKELYSGPGRNGQFKTDELAYFKRNTRPWAAYGYSCVEEAIPAATLYLERQAWMRQEYQSGSMPAGFIEAPSDKVKLENIAEWERVINNRLAGNTAERQAMKFLPQGSNITFAPSIDEKYRPEYDEFIIKRVAAIFGIAATTLGVLPRTGLSGKGQVDSEADNAETVSQKPMLQFIADMINSLSRRFLGADQNVTFTFNEIERGQGAIDIAQANQMYLFSGQKTLNDIQDELGQPAYDMPEADSPFIVAGNTVTFLSGLLDKADNGANGIGATAPEIPQEEGQGQEDGQAQGGAKESVGQAPQPKAGNDAGSVGTSEAKVAEAKAYKAFLAKGRKREFIFEYHTPEEVEILKAGLAPRPKSSLTKRDKADLPDHGKRTDLAKKHGKALGVALAAGVTGVGAAIDQAMRHGADMAMGAALGNVSFHHSDATSVLKDIWQSGGKAGAEYGASQLGKAVADSPSIQALLDKAGITLKGINDTTMTRIGNAIKDGIANGKDARSIGADVNLIINDPARADYIAATEVNRAYNAAAIDQYAANGNQYFYWIAYSSACEWCLSQESANPHPIDDIGPPEHPNCECSTSSVPI